MKKTGICCAVILAAVSLCADNLVRNGDFRDGVEFNGWRAIFSKEENLRKINSRSAVADKKQTPFAGWWRFALPKRTLGEFKTVAVPDSKNGGNRFRMTGPGGLESTPAPVPAGTKTLTLSFDLKTKDAQGMIRLSALTPWKDQGYCSYLVKKEEPFKATDGRVVMTVKIPDRKVPVPMLASVSFTLEKGTAEIGRVQIEPGETASPFERTPAEYFEVTLDGTPVEKLPRYSADSKRNTDVLPLAGKRTLTLRNVSGKTLRGTLNVYLDSWKTPAETRIRSFCTGRSGLENGSAYTMTIQPGKLEPDAYVILAEFIPEKGQSGTVSPQIFKIENTASGIVGMHQLTGRNGLRFCVFPGVEAKNLFGVGNGMIVPYTWWKGFDCKEFANAREYGVISFTGEKETFYQAAMTGALQLSADWIDKASGNPALNNPAGKNLLDVTNPLARKELARRAEARGRKMAEGPGFCGVKLRNESPYLNGGALCPTESADNSFREWLKERHGSLEKLNSRWRSNYKNWNEIEQIVSAKMREKTIADAKKNEKKGAAAYDWYANMGKLKVSLMQKPENAGRAMDWLRWRTWLSLKVYREYIETAKKFDKQTVYGNNFCWPNFWPQISMPFYRFSDAPMLDMQYAAPHRKDLGNSDEMLDMIEMAESVAKGKPVWGLEVYLQPDFPADYPALQNWALLAHGMTNNMVFGWRPFSDHGPKAYASGTKSWLKPKTPPMWMIYDVDGTKLPTWYSNKKSTKEIADFHKKYDALSLKRVGTKVAWYIPNDTAEYIQLSTNNIPYWSRLNNARIAAGATLRFSGVTMDYLDDDAILKKDALKNFDFVLMPPSPVMSAESCGVLADFVRNGGILVTFGPIGCFDPWLQPFQNYGGPAWSCLAWKLPKKWTTPHAFMMDFSLDTKGQATGFRDFAAGPEMQVFKNRAGKELIYYRTFGKGKLYAVANTPYRYGHRTAWMEPRLRELLQFVIEKTQVPRTAVWENIPACGENTPSPKKIGTGVPVVEAVVREQTSTGSLFVFVLNQGGEGQGKVRVWTGRKDRKVRVEDALTGKALEKSGVFTENGVWELPLAVKPWEYRVFRLTFAKGN